MKSDAPIALVTGVSSGIGEAQAERLARAGYEVVMDAGIRKDLRLDVPVTAESPRVVAAERS